MIILTYEPGLKEEDGERQRLEKFYKKIDELIVNMERLGIEEYVDMINNPRRYFFTNFLVGVVRGLGMAIGFTILAALVIYILNKIVVLNMPIIGDFIADIVEIVQKQLYVRGGN